jgi:DNA modification methylase/superfamily II DNA or RNA helicase
MSYRYFQYVASNGIHTSPRVVEEITDSIYAQFLKSKALYHSNAGLNDVPALNPLLFDFQRDIVAWALRKGRACIFADCGMGKTPMQLEWAHHIPGRVLILAPLAVAQQTIREATKFGIDAEYARQSGNAKITVTNYEMLEHFDPADYAGIVLDESSILKSYDGQFRNHVIKSFEKTPFRLACTATPAPNDHMELGNHAEFMGALTRTEMLSTFFVHDGGETSKWRLKGHAEDEFWKWVCSWAVMVRKPSDLGYDDGAFILPPLRIHHASVESGKALNGFLFPMPAQTLMERRQARAASVVERAQQVAILEAARSNEQWLIWCNLNRESEFVSRTLPGAIEVKGSDSREFKEQSMMDFAEGRIRILVSKPSICGFGMNFQSCHNVVFMGLSDSYEQFYQAMRRCWRFGQKSPVECYVVTSHLEGAVVSNIVRKEKDAGKMAEGMVKHMADISRQEICGATVRTNIPYAESTETGDGWTAMLGDCVEVLKTLPAGSVHYSIFSPPFASLYTYSASERDMGNCRTHSEFYEHFKFAIAELYRVLMPGRLLSFHCMNLPSSKERDGVIGIHDFRGELIRLFKEVGFIYHSEVVIWKDPVTAMQRTKALGLLHKQLKKDSCMSRQGIPDYLVTMRKPGENPERVMHTNESFPVQLWQQYASPVWMDINPSKTLQRTSAREEKDERHICPLQLEVIERAIELWTNPKNTVLSPFMGIGSEGYVALKMGRQFIGIELKQSYFDQAVKNLSSVEQMAAPLFAAKTQ